MGPADQPLPSDSSNSSMSISPAISEVGSPSAISGSNGTRNSTRALFGELTYLDVEKGIKKSSSGNLVNGNKKFVPTKALEGYELLVTVQTHHHFLQVPRLEVEKN